MLSYFDTSPAFSAIPKKMEFLSARRLAGVSNSAIRPRSSTITLLLSMIVFSLEE